MAFPAIMTLALDATNKTIEAVMNTAAYTTNPDFTAHYMDVDSNSVATAGGNDGTLNGTGVVTLIAAPSSGIRRLIRTITIQNRDVIPQNITVRYNNNSTIRRLANFTLMPGATWTTNGQFDGNGALKETFLLKNAVTVSSFDPLPQLQNGPSDGDNFRTDSTFGPLFWPVNITVPVAARHMNYLISGNDFVTSAGNGSQTMSLQFALYTRGTGSNSSLLSRYTSNSLSYGVTYSASSITVSQITTTNNTGYVYSTTASAGTNITSGYTGVKQIQWLINQTLTPNVYWVAVGVMQSTAGASVGIFGQSTGVLDPAWTLSPMGTVAQTTGSLGVSWHWPGVAGTWVSGTNAMPASVALTDIYYNGNAIQYFDFATTA